MMKKRMAVLFLTLALFVCLITPACAMTWDTDEASWEEGRNYCVDAEWDTRLQIDGLRYTGYVKYSDDDDYATVCYCDVPARVTVLEYVIDYGGMFEPVTVTGADVMDLGGSMSRCAFTTDGELVKEESVNPTQRISVESDEEGTMNGAGTYWELDEGIYYMFSVEASKTLFLVVGSPDGIPDAAKKENDAADGEGYDISFTDVTTDDWFYQPVRWAIAEGVTNGTEYDEFSPYLDCTQGQILTFLWRAAGKPKPTVDTPYHHAAVTAEQYYYDALLWAWQEGLVDNAALNPNDPCKRSDVVTYLWKLDKCPEIGSSVFTDVPADAGYANAVAWAVEAGITNGTSAVTFSPEKTCNRAQIVTFLYRYFV